MRRVSEIFDLRSTKIFLCAFSISPQQYKIIGEVNCKWLRFKVQLRYRLSFRADRGKYLLAINHKRIWISTLVTTLGTLRQFAKLYTMQLLSRHYYHRNPDVERRGEYILSGGQVLELGHRFDMCTGHGHTYRVFRCRTTFSMPTGLGTTGDTCPNIQKPRLI